MKPAHRLMIVAAITIVLWALVFCVVIALSWQA